MEKIKRSWTIPLAMTLLFMVPVAVAGPPLLCHPFDIGGATSLPWQQASAGEWNTPRADYDTERLSADTLSLLADNTPVVVRMETLRRAALYGAKDKNAADVLLRKLEERAAADSQGRKNALALFDYGYLIETMRQVAATKRAIPPDRNGYPMIREALRIRGNDPAMEFAAALVATWPKRAEREEHVRKAIAGASGYPLLAENVGRLNQ